MNNRCFAWTRMAAMALLFVAGTVAAQQSRFSSSQETGGAPGRYRVELGLRPGDDLAAISNQLAATYGARIETYAEEGFSGFAIIATPARARLMSSDPRVVAITDLNPAVTTDPPHRAAPTEAVVAPRADTLAVAVEQTRGIATEAVPGFGNYAYDPSGNITSIDTQDFRYDAFGRLQSADLGTFGTQAYTYDRYGNILKIVTDGDDVNAARMSVDPETNRMDLPFSGSNPANMIATYDGVGNVITHNGTFVYDALNMMKETTDIGRRLHVYSASDERVVVIQVQNGAEASSEWTLRDGGNRVLRRFVKDVSGAWHWKEDYIYGGTRLLAAEVPGSERVRHFHVDHLGTPRIITGNGGVRIAEKTYEPFGPKVSPATDDFEQLEFTGHERDMPALDYMHARYYQPDLRRFLSVDPAMSSADPRFPQSWNRYAYALNNPLKYVDPTGTNATVVCDAENNCTATVEAQIVADPNNAAQMAAATDFRDGAINYWQERQESGTNGENITFQVNISIVAPGQTVDGVDTLTVVAGTGRSNVQMSVFHGGGESPFDTGTIFTTDSTNNPSGMTGVAPHETGHLFGLRDMYAQGGTVPSWNASPTENIMRFGQPTNGVQTAFWVLSPVNGNSVVYRQQGPPRRCMTGPC